MASEYLKWKYRDVKPDEPPPELHGWPKVKNWLYYNWQWIAVGAIVVGVAGSMIWNMLGIGQVKPDYVFSYVGTYPLPSDTSDAVRAALESIGEDVNGDGQVYVELKSYTTGGEAAEEIQYAMAAQVTLVADMSARETGFFIVEDPDTFQKSYQVLAGPDGLLPADDDYSAEGKVFKWSDCPALMSVDLGRYSENYYQGVSEGDNIDVVKDLYLGIRGYSEGPGADGHGGDMDLWEKLSEGAVFK